MYESFVPCWESVEQGRGWRWGEPWTVSLQAGEEILKLIFLFSWAGTSIVQAKKLILVEILLLSFLFWRSLSLIPAHHSVKNMKFLSNWISDYILPFSCPGSFIPSLEVVSHWHSRIWIHRVTFETWDPSDIWWEWYLDKKTKRQKNKKTKSLILWCQGSFKLLRC